MFENYPETPPWMKEYLSPYDGLCRVCKARVEETDERLCPTCRQACNGRAVTVDLDLLKSLYRDSWNMGYTNILPADWLAAQKPNSSYSLTAIVLPRHHPFVCKIQPGGYVMEVRDHAFEGCPRT